MTPTIALVAGYPAGIAPELVAKHHADHDKLAPARIRLIAHRDSLEAAARQARIGLDVPALSGADALTHAGGVSRVEWAGWNAPAFPLGAANAANGAFMLDALRLALDLAQRGRSGCGLLRAVEQGRRCAPVA